MGRVLTNEEYLDKLKLTNPNIEPLEIYQKMIIKIKHRCKICGHIWNISPVDLTHGQSCPICTKERIRKQLTKSDSTYKNELRELKINIISLEIYISDRDKIKHKCLKCNYEWNATPCSVLNSKNCPKCAKNATYSTDEFKEKMSEINPFIEIVGEYTGSHNKIEYLCKQCSLRHSIRADALLSGQGCSNCRMSKGEREVYRCLQKYNVPFIQQYKFDKCKYIDKLIFDFYLPEYNMCIEYNGELHYMSIEHFGGDEMFKVRKERDLIKNNFCEVNNIKLLTIKYTDYSNIENIISQALNLNLNMHEIA